MACSILLTFERKNFLLFLFGQKDVQKFWVFLLYNTSTSCAVIVQIPRESLYTRDHQIKIIVETQFLFLFSLLLLCAHSSVRLDYQRVFFNSATHNVIIVMDEWNRIESSTQIYIGGRRRRRKKSIRARERDLFCCCSSPTLWGGEKFD